MNTLSDPKPQGETLESFEQAFEELEAIVAKFEQGELKLDESLALFERGTRLAGLCEKKLDEAESKLAKLMQELSAQPESPKTITD